MAIVSSPLKSEGARGSVGRTTYSVWRATNTARIRSVPTQPRTARQMIVRNILATLSRAYQQLTAGQADTWRDYANDHEYRNSFGSPFAGTGMNAFVGTNFYRLDNDDVVNEVPPVTPPPASLQTITTAAPALPGIGCSVLLTAFGTPSADDYIEVQVTRAFASAGRRAQESDYRHVAYEAGNDLDWDVTGLVENAWYWLRVRYIDQYGQATPFLSDQFQAAETEV